ncbi:MAG: ABC transporter permease subunit [Planctomycetota bacterium]
MTTPDSNTNAPSARVHRRNRNSSAMVRVSDRIAKHVITIGGIGTILVVLMVVVVLLANVIPLFRGADVKPLARLDVPASSVTGGSVMAFGLDEYNDLVWLLHRDHRITVHATFNSELLADLSLRAATEGSTDPEITAVAVDGGNSHLLLGYSNGSIRPAALPIEVDFQKLSDMPTDIAKALKLGPVVENGSIYRLTAGNLVRQTRISRVEVQDPISLFEASIDSLHCLVRKDDSGFEESTQWVWGASSGRLVAMGTLAQKPGMLGGSEQTETQIWRSEPDESVAKDAAKVSGVMVGSRAEALQSIDKKGEVTWWMPVDNDRLSVKQTYVTITGSESQATCFAPSLGGSWLIGGASGHVESVAFAATDTGRELLSIHRVPVDRSPIVAVASAPASRMFAAINQSGAIALRYATSEGELARWEMPASEPAKPLSPFLPQFNANGNALAVLDQDRLLVWNIDAPFPEASWSTFFSKIWYEGYPEPRHIWQSSTGSSEGETKFGMWPLIFGTLKATFYSMLIAAPIALLAAIFGSEFMSRSWRLRFKPLIELMASIPSVVLGFIGAMVLAPFLREHLAWVLLSALLTLVLFLLAAHLWMLIPPARSIPLRRYRLPLMFCVPPIAMLVAWQVSPSIERWLFQAKMTEWLGNPALGVWPGWFLLSLLPMALLVVWALFGPLRSAAEGAWERLPVQRQSLRSLLTFVLGCVATVLLSMLAATILSSLGWDARGSVLGPYQERNALLVGGILGFAIIPLVYTLADDALQSVPQHLRSASLGCGATVWQTTTRVVVPTAMSGLFSALMIGFGRAIGETMVVLMAAGNTPLMEINPFNGYRTLSATLATELPEAARGSTHYHTLFLAALLLFCFTLVINTCAEWVRIRFRKRAYQL